MTYSNRFRVMKFVVEAVFALFMNDVLFGHQLMRSWETPDAARLKEVLSKFRTVKATKIHTVE